MDIYEQLRDMLDAHPAGAPQSKSFDEILRILFTPEEASLAVHMGFRPKICGDIAKAAGIEPDAAAELLEAMASKAVIFAKQKKGAMHYSLVSTIPGLFEFPFMKGGGTPELKMLGALWEQYHQEALGKAFCGEPTPMIRVVPIEASVSGISTIHPYEEVKHLIETGQSMALTNCACRASLGKCDAPLEVCIIFGDYARFLTERGYARLVEKDEALAALEKAEEAGLVHTSNNSADEPLVLCSCCPCCCTVLRGRTQLNHPHAFAPSRFEARIDPDSCTGCGICADERCHFNAITMGNGAAVVDPENCVGCGLCITGCPAGAVGFQERAGYRGVPANAQIMAMQVLQEKGKLERFMALAAK